MSINDKRIDGGKAFDWGQEHITMLEQMAPEEFHVLHYAAMAELTKK